MGGLLDFEGKSREDLEKELRLIRQDRTGHGKTKRKESQERKIKVTTKEKRVKEMGPIVELED